MIKKKKNEEKKETSTSDTTLSAILSPLTHTTDFDIFRSSSKLIKTFSGHSGIVSGIDYSTFDGNQLICSGSRDGTVRVWDIDSNKQIQLLNEHPNEIRCVKFSSYYYRKHRRN
ncbi:hypothetical protein RFI_01677, partial [Reticulomyxa filosa]